LLLRAAAGDLSAAGRSARAEAFPGEFTTALRPVAKSLPLFVAGAAVEAFRHGAATLRSYDVQRA